MRSEPEQRRTHRPRRQRLPWVGLVFVFVAAATAFAVHRLYATVQREFDEQAQRALHEERERAHARVRAHVEEVRRSIIAQLASFHVDGLAQSLQRWAATDPMILATFQWESTRGFLPGVTLPVSTAAPEILPRLWQDFRPRAPAAEDVAVAASAGAGDQVGPYVTRQIRTRDNPWFAAGTLGYQEENLEMLTYAGRTADPWAGWAGHAADPAAPWIFWYQAGPDAAVRGCFLDTSTLVATLRTELGDSRLARLALVAGAARGADDQSLRELLPAYGLRAEPGDVFREKQGGARFAGVTVALLLGAFLLGVTLLTQLARREAREAERKTTFVSQVSHELRTPITSIRMFADLLGAAEVAEDKRIRFAGTISRESRRLGTLIERLLTLASLEKGNRAPVPLQAVEVAAVVRETLEETAGVLQDAGMTVESRFPSEPVAVRSDAAALKQALLNLVDNAARHARAGGVVRVTVEASSREVVVRVADRGPGIPRGLRSRVFEPFVQGSDAITDKAPGLGLGLSIARGLLREAGADLVLVPAENGATFEIRLPRAFTA